MWLSLVTRPELRKTLCASFMEKLVLAINKLDTKETKLYVTVQACVHMYIIYFVHTPLCTVKPIAAY